VSSRPPPKPSSQHPPRQRPLTPQAEEAVKRIHLDLLKDIRRVATIHAKNDTSNVIDVKHIVLARRQLTNKHRGWMRSTAQLSTLVGGALLGVLATVILDATANHCITLTGGILLALVTAALIFVGIQNT
jgi:hypothetical protein